MNLFMEDKVFETESTHNIFSGRGGGGGDIDMRNVNKYI